MQNHTIVGQASGRASSKQGLSRTTASRRLRFEALESRQLLAIAPELLKDIGDGDGSDPGVFRPPLGIAGSSTFFVVNEGTGPAIWKSDGTTAGTVLVKNQLAPNSNINVGYMTNVNGTLFFKLNNANYGYELWKSDGTAAGTMLVKDINPGTAGSAPSSLVNYSGVLYFRASDGINGNELWRTDGTAAGTFMVKDILTGSSGADPSNLTVFNGVIYFGANGTGGNGLWRSDGTAAGTTFVKSFSSNSVQNLTNVSGTLFFSASDGATNGVELWKSDGTTAGTVIVKNIRTGINNSSSPSTLANVGGTLFFKANDGTTGIELWKSDGTAAGTVLVKDIRSGSAASFSQFQELVNVNGTLLFSANNGTNGYELWKSDGTNAGTVMVTDLSAGSAASSPTSPINLNGALYFQANDGATGTELWKSDGTAAGTVLIKDIRSGVDGSGPKYLTNLNGALFFSANDGPHGAEPWISDGTTAGTTLLADINSHSASPSNPRSFTELSGTIYFNAKNSLAGYELWKTDGTTAGTVLLKDIVPGGGSSSPGPILNLNGHLVFAANDGSSGNELWTSDGTEAGTMLLADILPGSGSSEIQYATIVDGTLFFRANNGANGRELWKTDGTAAGTTLVKDVQPGSAGSGARGLQNANGTLFFFANDGTNGYELWKSDGTSAGTVMVKDIVPGSGSSVSQSPVSVGGLVFFVAGDSSSGKELWKSDGTAAGTVMVKDIIPGSVSSGPSALTNVNGNVYFTADDGTTGIELWKSDGTAAGTHLVKDITVGSASASATSLTAVANTLYFIANDGTSGGELWKSDGTTAGTTMVKEIRSGINGAGIGEMIAINGLLIFSADDNVNGRELWLSDGTAASTQLITDAYPGVSGSNPNRFTNINGTMYFAAYDPNAGLEPFTLVVPQRTLSIAPASHIEGNAVAAALITVTMSGPNDQPVTVAFTTGDGTATLADNDYQATSGTLTFTPGQTTALVTVLVNGDTQIESDESFSIALSNPIGATIDTATATVLIVDDDPWPLVSLGPTSLAHTEGNSGQVAFVFSVTLSAPSIQDVVVSYGTADGTATVADGDYLTNSGVLTFTPGESTKLVTVLANGDMISEADESFTISLSNPSHALLGVATAEGMIQDDEPQPVLTLSPSSLANTENDSGVVSYVMTVALSSPSALQITVAYGTSDGSATLADNDYQATSGVLTFAPGETTRLVTVLVNGDTINEANETFSLNLSTPTNATLGVATATNTVTNDDPVPAVSISPATASILEGDAGATPGVYTVSLSAVSGQTVTVAYATSDGSATLADGDYQAASGVLTFAPGETSKPVTVLANGDTANEANESFTLSLSAPANATLGTFAATATITNDDPVPAVTLGPATIAQTEGDAGTTPYLFTATLSAVSGQPVTVAYDTADGSATLANNDYQVTSGILTFSPGQTSKLVTVLVNGDTTYEADEDFSLSLSGPTNATLGSAAATATITNDDPVPGTVDGRFLFYNQSAFDGGNAAQNAGDDGAIATDKSAYLPNNTLADFANVSSYSRGINGIMIDLGGGGSHAAINANDFVFKHGNNNGPNSWTTVTATPTMSVRVGAGTLGSDRVTITWANNSIKNEWLEVQVLPTANTGLTAADVFFWGNKVGDTGAGTPATSFLTSATDKTSVVNNQLGGVPITNTRDFNRDGNVTVADATTVVNNQGTIERLQLNGGPFAPLAAESNESEPVGDAGIASALAVSGGSLVLPGTAEPAPSFAHTAPPATSRSSSPAAILNARPDSEFPWDQVLHEDGTLHDDLWDALVDDISAALAAGD